MRIHSSLISAQSGILNYYPAPASIYIDKRAGSYAGWDEQGNWLEPSQFILSYRLLRKGQVRLKKSSVTSNLDQERAFHDKNETVNIETSIKEIISEDLYEYDVIVPLVPKRKYKVKLNIRSIKKAKPTIVGPEWI